MIILHYVTAIKIKLSLVIIVTWHFVSFSRDGNLELISHSLGTNYY